MHVDPDKGTLVRVSPKNYRAKDGRRISDASLLSVEERRDIGLFVLKSADIPKVERFQVFEESTPIMDKEDMTLTPQYLIKAMPPTEAIAKAKSLVATEMNNALADGCIWPGKLYSRQGEELADPDHRGFRLTDIDRTRIGLIGDALESGEIESHLYHIGNGRYVKLSTKEDANVLSKLGFTYQLELENKQADAFEKLDALLEAGGFTTAKLETSLANQIKKIANFEYRAN
ncbi:hypothetical protein [Vibrio phage BONAISHI]|nr:hypothetical protein [Vibrio phage BONAISHI]